MSEIFFFIEYKSKYMNINSTYLEKRQIVNYGK